MSSAQCFDDALGRIPPHNTEAEMCVLGAMMLSDRAAQDVVTRVSEDEFYIPAHREIYRAMRQVAAESKAVDMLTIKNELVQREKLDTVGGVEYLIQIAESVPSASNALHYAHIVQEHATLRRLEQAGHDIVKLIRDPELDMKAKIEAAEKAVYDVGKARLGREFESVGDLAMSFFDQIDHMMETDEPIQGLLTGYDDLDELTRGFFPGELTILASRPAMGKTSLALNFAVNAARKNAGKVAFFSLEMGGKQLVRRLMSVESRVPMKAFNQRMSDDDYQRLINACERMYGMQIYVDETPDISPFEMRAKCRRLNSAGDLALVVVDYLQLMKASKRTENRVQEIGDISRGLKQMAKELDVPVIALAQVSRGVENRDDRRPRMADLRESGSIEADADVVMFIYRDEYYERQKQGGSFASDEDPNRAEIAELIIAKHRNGPVDMVPLAFQPSLTRFSLPDVQSKLAYKARMRDGGVGEK